jgi:hypothetical protein
MNLTFTGDVTVQKDGLTVAQGSGVYTVADGSAPPPPPPAPPDYEAQYWHNLCAMLDPAAYVHVMGTVARTVPAGEEWLMVNGWNLVLNGAPFYYRRTQPMNMPAGFTFSGASATAFSYVCRPSLVSYADPKAKYFERLARRKDLPIFSLAQSVTTTGIYKAFPTDFENGLIVAADCYDAAWTILANPSTGLMNVDDEISDTVEQRVAGPMSVAFRRSVMPGIMVRGAGLSGVGSVLYLKLPLDW